MATRPAPAPPASSSNTSPTHRYRTSSGKARIGQYIIERTLGSGSFGKVKLATHAITGHQVALKFINRAKITTPDMNARVKREIQYLKVLRHPHIIKLYEVITTPTDVIMVMEYAGEELFTYIVTVGKGGMPQADAMRFFQQIVAALEYCHKHQIVHRDLKPENLFLDSHLNIKIGDFGLSNLMTDGDFLKTSCGSPNYAAPEVISGKLYSGPEIDVWSAGVILFVLLVGRLPFDDDNIPVLFKKIENGNYVLPSHVSEEARYLLKRMLTVDPVKRATISEIRNMPIFQDNLPRYLQPLPEIDTYPALPMDDMATLLMINEGQADPKKVADANGMIFSEDLGIIDPKIVAELLERISTYTEAMVWDALQQSGDNQVKVAYQLVRDHKRILKGSLGMEDESSAMEDFMASSPPAWNAEIPRPQSTRNVPTPDVDEENDWDEEDPEIQDIPNAHFDVLQVVDAEEGVEAPSKPSMTEETEKLLPKPAEKTTRPKWHFGIRSRSPPMEVMLEIYKTLAILGMQWKRKEGITYPEIGPEPAEGYPTDITSVLQDWEATHGVPYEMGKPAPSKRDIQARDKAAQDLYLVQTRARYGAVMVRMDLQLYRVDQENFLVDFKNIGYYPATDAQQRDIPEASSDALSSSHGHGSSSGRKVDGTSIGGVSGPFHFLEMACQLITELASG